MTAKQLKLDLYKGTWGGRRPGSGRKRIHSQGVAHRMREKVTSRTPLHINFKYRTSVRNKFCLKLLKRAIKNARSHGLRIVHFSLQSNHVHLIVECESNETLTRGMRSLTITFAKGLKLGRIQLERYHLHVLKTAREAHNAIQYVLFNQQKHEKRTYSKIDEYSSALYMDNAMEIIRNFALKNKITLAIKKIDSWDLDEGRSYLLKQGLGGLLPRPILQI